MNPRQQTIQGLIKIYKPEAPIRPIKNWQQAPAYSLAKLLSDRLKLELQLPFTFNVNNSLQLMTELQNMNPYIQNLRLASFDISNMYTNISTSEIPHLITKICDYQNTTNQTKQELLLITKAVLKQY
jgi:hypothetical protein